MVKREAVESSEAVLFSIKSPQIPSLNIPEDKSKINITYPLIEPFVQVRIYWDNNLNEVIYKIEEPELDENERTVLNLTEEGIKELINISLVNIKDENVVIEYLEKSARILLTELRIKISVDSFVKIMYYIYRDFIGLNEFEPLMRDPFIEDIECNGINTPVYVVHRRLRNLKTNLTFNSIPYLASLVEKMAQKSGKYVSYANPLLDASLPNGDRINATYTQDISTKGPTVTIRRFTKDPWTPTKLMKNKTVSPEMLAYIWILLENESNIMVIGGTGSGKTSILNAIAFFIPPPARIVSIEDTHELQLMHENWLPSVSREATAGFGGSSKQGEITLFDLLKESFRQRPDYVIVGEIRGVEAYVLFQGMASGHSCMGTMHAEDVATMIRRLETPPINLSPSLVDSLDVVCTMSQIKIGGEPRRKLTAIVEILKVTEEQGKAITNMAFIWNPANDKFLFKSDLKVFDKICQQKGITKEQLFKEFQIRVKLLIEMYKRNILEITDVYNIINEYYKNPQGVLKRLNIQ